MNELFDITEVCRMLGTTARTLRFYEQKGLIESTVEPFSTRRRYGNTQIHKIRNVLVLRSLGLPIRKIQELQKGDKDLISAVSERRAEVLASITSKVTELNILNEAISMMDSGKDIFEVKTEQEISIKSSPFNEKIVKDCTDAFISGNYGFLHNYFCEELKAYLPLSAFEHICIDTVKPLGRYITVDRTETDRSLSNVIYAYLKYEKLGLYIKFVFNNEEISGIWLNYYSVESELR